MPTYNIKLNVNICAPTKEDAIRQLPAYARNHAVISTDPITIRHSAMLSYEEDEEYPDRTYENGL